MTNADLRLQLRAGRLRRISAAVSARSSCVTAVGHHSGASAAVVATATDWEFGYQGIAGIRYNINPSLAFDLDYRYFGDD